ncbi:ABC transporter, ATP-binding protein [Trichuris suis]|nr:ABC transporter, ATP-binding protein [Trichuris suis]
MHNLRLEYYNGNYDQFEKTKTELLANQQREYEAQKMHRAHVQEFIDRFRYNAKRASLVQSKIKMLEKLFPPCDSLNPPIIQLENVSFHYAKERPVLRNVGDNGSGKTTFLKLIVGMLDPVKGERRLHRLLKVAYFTQHHVDQLVMDVNPVELIQQRYPGTKYEECRSALGRFGITGDLALQRISTLSGGQKSRLAFSLLSVMKPNFLILDEPTNHLDIETVDALGEALRQFGGGVIVVTHEERLIKMVCKELLIIRDGIVTQLEGGIEEYKACIQKELAKLI